MKLKVMAQLLSDSDPALKSCLSRRGSVLWLKKNGSQKTQESKERYIKYLLVNACIEDIDYTSDRKT